MLVWIPCVFLWLFCGLDFFYIRNSLNRNIPWNILNISKLIITLLLVILTICDLGSAISRQSEIDIYPVDYYTPAIKIGTFVSKNDNINFY